MSQTLDNIILPIDEWVSLYDHPTITGGGIVVSDVLRVNVIDGKVIQGYSGATKPGAGAGFTPIYKTSQYINEAADLGAWMISRGANGLINVSRG